MRALIHLLIGLVISSLLISCSDSNSTKKRITREHLVEVSPVKIEAVAIERERTGTLRSNQEIQIFNQEEGRITVLPLHEGDKVKKGDIVARLDDRLLQAELSRTRALRNKAEKDLQRIKGLAKKNLTAQTELTRVETELAVARADEQALLTRLDYATIRSPIDGIISQRLSEPGNIAERYTHLLTISDQSSLITEVTVSELLINKFKTGDKVQLTIDALDSNEPLEASIYRIHPDLNPVTRNGMVEIKVDAAPLGSRPGQLARAYLRTQATDRMLIPFTALRRDQTGEYVFIVEEGKAKRVNVTTGLRVETDIEIRQGLEENQNVIIRGFSNLSNNKAVNIINLEQES
jgi:membrane fusion protein (multidrug efflux system)